MSVRVYTHVLATLKLNVWLSLSQQDVERTFHQLHGVITRTQHTAFQQPTRNAFKKKVPLSDADFAAWRASTRELLSAFLLLKPQIGYCQVRTWEAPDEEDWCGSHLW